MASQQSAGLQLLLNGELRTVDDPDPRQTLLDYLRSPEIGLTGAKLSCGEGGCGACTVLLGRWEPRDTALEGWGCIRGSGAGGVLVERAVNACLTPLCSVDGMAVTTIEGLSDVNGDLHPVARQLVVSNGSQCGYCSPGWVMSMHGLLSRREMPAPEEIEQSFDGHICRCTGYRAILDAMQCFAADGIARARLASHRPLASRPARATAEPRSSRFGTARDSWRRVLTLDELLAVWAEASGPGLPDGAVRLVAGNTAAARDKVPDPNPRLMIDISSVPELNRFATGEIDGTPGFVVGGGVTFARLIAELDATGTPKKPRRCRFAAFAQHLRRAANAQVRNRATLGGHIGLYLAHTREITTPFLSDLLPLLVACDARIRWVKDPHTEPAWVTLEEAVGAADDGPGLILEILLPFASRPELFGADRVARRPQNAKPLVSAAWRLVMDHRGKRIEDARIAYCGLGVGPLRARAAERALSKVAVDSLSNPGSHEFDVLAQSLVASFPERDIALMSGNEVAPDDRRRLARDLFLRFLVQGEIAGPVFERPVSFGTNRFNEDHDPGPLGEPLPKHKAKLQTSGKARYTADLSGPPGTLQAVYVTSTISAGRFAFKAPHDQIVDQIRQQVPELVDFVAAHSLTDQQNQHEDDELLFAKDQLTCFGQPVALVLAHGGRAAREAAQLLTDQHIAWNRNQNPVLSLDQARQRNAILGEKVPLPPAVREIDDPGDLREVEGCMRTGAQAHFYMEPQAILAVPDDDGGITLTASAQHLGACQEAVCKALDLPANKVRLKTSRIGGGFGGKETRTPPIAAAAAVGAMRTGRPVRLVLDRDADTTIVGYRHPFEGRYRAAFDSDGRIHRLCLEFDVDGGNSADVTPHVLELAMLSAEGAYDVPGFQVKGVSYRTHRMTRTAMRTFGVIQCSLICETAIEHVAHALHKQPEEIRERNFYADAGTGATPVTPYGQPLDYCIIHQIWQQLHQQARFSERAEEVEHFNKVNTWRKRGIAMTPIKYGVAYTYLPYNQGSAYIAVYADDGTVLIHTGAVEMGQGVNTKLIQLAAETLGIGMQRIDVAPAATEVIPNASSSGASVGADLHGGALELACQTLRRRLEAMCRDLEVDGDAPPCWSTSAGWRRAWPDIVKKAYKLRIDLTAEAHYRSPEITGFDAHSTSNKPFLYFTYSAACSEVEIDVLTGEFDIRRTDILYDAGRSLNPLIDTGQIQGGFVQGLGNLTTEEIYYDDSHGDGAPLSSNFWNYKPPCSKAIPAEFNTSIYQYDNAALNADPRLPFAVWRSKSTGEPPAVLANSVFFAIRRAVAAARADQGWKDWFPFDAPATVVKIQRACREEGAPERECRTPQADAA